MLEQESDLGEAYRQVFIAPEVKDASIRNALAQGVGEHPRCLDEGVAEQRPDGGTGRGERQKRLQTLGVVGSEVVKRAVGDPERGIRHEGALPE